MHLMRAFFGKVGLGLLKDTIFGKWKRRSDTVCQTGSSSWHLDERGGLGFLKHTILACGAGCSQPARGFSKPRGLFGRVWAFRNILFSLTETARRKNPGECGPHGRAISRKRGTGVAAAVNTEPRTGRAGRPESGPPAAPPPPTVAQSPTPRPPAAAYIRFP